VFHFSVHKYLVTFVGSNCYISLSFFNTKFESLQVLVKSSGVQFRGDSRLTILELLHGHESCTLGASERSWKRQKFWTLNLI